MWAVIPVKRLELSKQRLAGVLSAPQRAALMTAMIEDVLAALSKVQGLTGRLLVTRDEQLSALAARYGAEVLCERATDTLSGVALPPANGHAPLSRDSTSGPENGLCRALEEACVHLRDRGARGMLIVPGDVPLIDAADIDTLLQSAHEGTVTIVPDHDHAGTNALLLVPPGSIGFRFGVDSCRRHQQAAQDAGLRARVVPLTSLALDVDAVEDLAQLRLRGAGTRAHQVLMNIADGTGAFGARAVSTLAAP